ncbi:MAG TPA: recombination protein O N-terminal domain-containing protein, partial [Elusimicrobiota bacterium]|nr:recombination protein O N-terminal domain-containing protein [Elusimicrobiota bacterium]
MYHNVAAVVLGAEPASETDKRLTLFTREKGRLFARAAGARRPGAKLAAATEPASLSRFRLWLPEGGATARVTG